MESFLQTILKPPLIMFELIGRLCKPVSTEMTLQEEVNYQRNKIITNFYVFVIICMLLQMLFKASSVLLGCVMIAICISVILLLMISSHYNPSLFRFYLNLVIGLSGPGIFYLNYQGGQRAWLASQLYPTLVLLSTGSLPHFLFQAGLQMILINWVYQPQMMHYLDFTSSQDYLSSLTRNTINLNFLSVIVIMCLDASLKKAYNKVLIAEQKKDEFERQKLFLLSFSHELRNMINNLMGNIKLASLETLSGKAKSFIQNADLCAESLLHLINNILDTGKVEVGDLEINPTSINIYDTMDRIWRICSEQIKGKGLYGNFKFYNHIPEVLQVDHHRLMQIFFNLIGNAVKFTERGSINITLEWISNTDKVTPESFEPCPFEEESDFNEGLFDKSQQVSVLRRNYLTLASCSPRLLNAEFEPGLETQKGILKVIVTDTGHGIGKDDAAKLFQKFTQVSSDPSKRKLGTGLGLFITKEICEKMGGEIRMFSKEGYGSSVIFCIPVTPIPSNPLLCTSNCSEAGGNKKLRALIVDDELLSLSILKNFFCKLDVEVLSTAQNGLEGYSKYVEHVTRNHKVNVVTMDLTMPVMDGKKAAAKIREYEAEKGIEPCVLIVISANCSESEIAECTDKNGRIRANYFVKKPARIDEIERVISQFRDS